ncbi:MAG: hypothetical protein ACMV1B_09090 [Prevotella sp.]
MPKVIAAGETITIPAGRMAILPNVQVDGTLDIQGEVFIPSGSTTSSVVTKVTSTDNAIVRFNGTTGDVQNSGVTIDDSNNINFPTGARITGDFSNSTYSNRVALQTSALNSLTGVEILPSGTATDSKLNTSNNSDIANASIMSIGCNSTYSYLYAGKRGTGSYLPIDFLTSDTQRMRIDTAGNVLVTNSGGGLGYGTGAGGTVTQLTSKSTAVTLNKPTGKIITSNSALASGVYISFTVNNTLVTDKDVVILTGHSFGYNYRIEINSIANGYFAIRIANVTAGSLSEALVINFTVIKGATA